ncbi:MAG: outer membrane protein OmpA-like peptidoglycan-associated protein [Alphaproteobacteria bacterium]|jgi:outer membrane protein OmpA-like peptidoglycan-associated protein
MKLYQVPISVLLFSSAFCVTAVNANYLPANTITNAHIQGETQNGFKSLNDIEKQLAATDISVNYGGVKVSVDLNIEFAFGKADLMPSAKSQIEVLAQALNNESLKSCNIALTGHTDAVGSAAKNLALSQARANSLKQELVIQYGYAPERLIAQGEGETKLLDGLALDDGRHRRVEVSLIEPESCRKEAESNGSIEW